MKMKDYFASLPVGEVVNKRGLAYLKRIGFIWDYSQFGYLESVNISLADDYDKMRYAFPKGNAKELERYESAMYEKWRQGHADTGMTYKEYYEKFGLQDTIVVNGIEFRPKYFDGCFNAYLVKSGPANGNEVHHRMAFRFGVV